MALSDAIDQSAVARVVGIKTEFVPSGSAARFLPQVVGLIGQGRSDVSYPTDKVQITTALEAAQIFGFGSPIHLAAMQLKPDLGGGLSTIPLLVCHWCWSVTF